MDTPSSPPQQPPLRMPLGSDVTLTQEFEHVAQEMYKKNLELNERNKTLSLLRRIDEIILSSVTDTQQIAQQVADAIVEEEGFKAVIILTLDKESNSLVRIAVSKTDAIAILEKELNRSFQGLKTPLTETSNTIVRAVQLKTFQVTHDLFDVLTPHFTRDEAEMIQEKLGISSSLAYPLIVRNQVIGGIIISIGDAEELMPQLERDLIFRLSRVIGIAIDNALLYQEIQNANEKLKQLDHLKDEFLSIASHELRTPMTAIKSYLWMALAGKGGVLSEKQSYYLSRAYQSTDRLIKLVNEMLNVSRIESGRITLELTAVDIEKLLHDVVEELMPRAQELGVRLVVNAAAGLPAVMADVDKIKEVIINLVGNSMKFTPKDGTITITCDQRDGKVEVKVIDTGVGIATEDLAKLFQKFSLVGNEALRKQNAQGTGLGLYISKSIVQLHGGQIAAFSEGENKGATFSFSLKPFNKEEAEHYNTDQEGKTKVGIIHTDHF